MHVMWCIFVLNNWHVLWQTHFPFLLQVIRRPLGNLPLHKYVVHSLSLGRVAIPDWSQAKGDRHASVNSAILGSDLPVTCLVFSHYQNQCWYIIDWNPRNKFSQISIQCQIVRVMNITYICICLIRIYWRVSHSSASPPYTMDLNLFITVLLDARVLDGTRPSAGAVPTTKSCISFSVMKFH